MSAARPRRSVLYVPGANPRALEKARALPCDAVILDLEDSVAPAAKTEARERVARLVADRAFAPREVVVRVNHAWSAWGSDDIAAVAAAEPDAVLLPKVETAEDILAAGRALDQHGAARGVAIWAMMETARAVLEASAIAGAVREADGARLAASVVGTNDLALETRVGLEAGRAVLTPWLMGFVAAARANGLAILDGVFGRLDDAAGFAAECVEGRAMGMDGKTLIHPAQIAAANRIFGPSDAELAWARRVVAAFAEPEAASAGVIRLDGQMVERLHLAMAERLLATAEAIAARG